MVAMFAYYARLAKSESEAVPMKPGSGSFYNGLTIYGSGVNMTNGFWCAPAFAYMPEGRRFNFIQNIYQMSTVVKLNLKSLLMQEQQNLLIISKAAILCS